MSIFDSNRPTDYNAKLDLAANTARTRRNNRNALKQNQLNKEREQLILEALDRNNVNDTHSYDSDSYRKIGKRNALLRNRSLATLESRLVEKGYPTVFNNIVFGIVYESFWADDSIKEATIHGMYETYEEILSTLESLNIKPVSEHNQNQFIKNLRDIAMEACKKTAKRKVDEAIENKDGLSSDDIENIDFSMNDSEQTELDSELSDLTADDMAQLVKNKVLQVVQDEQMSGKAKKEIINEIDEKQKELNDEMSETDGGEDDDTETKDATEESVSLSRLQLKSARKHLRRVTGNSLFECLMMGSVKSVTENVGDGKYNKLDIMDGAFMETMMKYTVLETLNTIGLYKFTIDDVRKLKDYYKN